MELGILITLIIVERFYPLHKLNFFKKDLWLDVVWYFFLQNVFLNIAIFLLLDELLKNYAFQIFTPWPLAVQVIVAILIIDFIDYWIHRFTHYSPFMWRIHQVHHSTTELNSLSTFRQHLAESVIGHTVQFGVIIGLGVATEVLPFLLIFQSFFAFFSHSNLKIKLGPLAYIFNTPEMHHWHHADDERVRHKNFANQLAIWDWMFGTAFNPKETPEKYGLAYEFPDNYFLQLVYSVYPFDVKVWQQNPKYPRLLKILDARKELWAYYKQKSKVKEEAIN